MNKAKLLKNRLQASIDFAVKMNEDLDSVSWNYQEGVLLSCNEAKLVIELINKLTIPRVVNCKHEDYTPCYGREGELMFKQCDTCGEEFD